MNLRPVLCVLLLCAVSFIAEAQKAVLVSGPSFRKGLPFFEENALPYFQAQYSVGDAAISVWITHESIVFVDWRKAACASGNVIEREVSGRAYFSTQLEGQWVVFIEFPADYTKSCSFISSFVERFNFFSRKGNDPIPPLPALFDVK